MTSNRWIDGVDIKMLLSTIWIFILLNMFIKDIHEIITAKFLAQAMTGVINGTTITERLLFLSAFMVEIPIGMVLLSRLLNYNANRWANILAAVVTIGVVIANPPGDLDDMFFGIVVTAALLAIVYLAWKWPEEPAHLEA